MSDIRFNQWLHQSGTGGVTQLSTGHVGIGTTDPLIPVHAGNNAVLNVGVVTANSYYGSGANLTSIPAANLTGTLPAISGANLTSLPAANLTGTLPAISGANLTNLPAANLTGTLPAISGANLTGIDTDLLSDTSPQLGADLDTNSFEILFDDAHAAKFGNSSQFQIKHDGGGGDARLINTVGNLYSINSTNGWIILQPVSGQTGINVKPNAAVELMHSGTKKLETSSDGITVTRNTSDTTMSNTSQLVLRNENNGANTFAGIRFEVSSNTATDHFIVQKKHSGGSGTDLIVGHGSNERIRFIESGGITFHGDTAAANALDDYEEGSWTPAYNTGSAAGACFAGGESYNTGGQTGRYTKIGNIVHFRFNIDMASGFTAKTGILQINGLPFAAKNETYVNGGAAFFMFTSAFGSATLPNAVVVDNSQFIQFYDGNGGLFRGVDLSAPQQPIQMAGFYQTA